jgi:O-acetyl-ADP-ribose deacetylase (regulator of RNase III)
MSRIYVSSTFEDLREHRGRVYRQLRRVGHDVIAMEDYVAQDERPLVNCLADISSCDLYVGLFAWRYGFVPEDHNPGGLSITELEYRHATAKGKDSLVFLLDEKFPWSPLLQDSHTGNGEGGKHIQRLREELSRNKQVGLFGSPDDLASLVGAAVEKSEKQAKQKDARNRDEASRVAIAQLTAEKKIVAEKQIGQVRLTVINDDIRHTTMEVIVSSDDNHFTARDGISKILLDKLGADVRRELDHYQKAGFRQGQVAVTTGGNWGRRAIIHAAVIDLDDDLYPTPQAIRTVTRRSLVCAVALGARSIAFPVLGGGYASKRMNSHDCVNAIATEILAFMTAEDEDRDQLRGIRLYIFNPQDNAGLPDALLDTGGGP